MFLKKFLIMTAIFAITICVVCAAEKEDSMLMKISPIDTIFSQGEPNPYSEFFTGQTYLNMLNTKEDVWNLPIGNVTFEPGARTNWHKHSGGQILLVLNGEGRYKEDGKPVRILKKGDIVTIPPNVKHWHGASSDSWFVHVSLEPNAEINKTTWLEPVDDKQYNEE